MKKKKKAVKGHVVSPEVAQKLIARATEVDDEIVASVGGVKASIVELGRLLDEVKHKKLWLYVKDPRSRKHGFESEEDYKNYRLGPLRKSRAYDLMMAAALTTGENPIPGEVIDKLGVKKAVAIHRLPPAKRTKEVIASAMKKTVAQVQKDVQDEINRDLPEEERREATTMFARNLANSVVDRMIELERIGMHMQNLKDDDRSMSLQSKFWEAVCIEIEKDPHFEEAKEIARLTELHQKVDEARN